MKDNSYFTLKNVNTNFFTLGLIKNSLQSMISLYIHIHIIVSIQFSQIFLVQFNFVSVYILVVCLKFSNMF
jgi:hypothetical protein